MLARLLLFLLALTSVISSAEELPTKARHLLRHEWMRDPYIYKHGDTFYLTATRLDEISWGTQGIELWSSHNLTDWESVGVPWTFDHSSWIKHMPRTPDVDNPETWLWAPEIYFINNQWVALHSTNRRRANLLVSFGGEYNDSYSEPFGENLGHRHDPSLFTDDDGSRWLVWACATIAKLNKTFSAFETNEITIGPSDRHLGHEGCTIRKIGQSYVLFGTAWSTDRLSEGTYNLYYCTATKLTGPYGPRRFAARFCGQGTPFQDNEGNWWTTAFQNGHYETDPEKGQLLCQSKQAWTINPQGLTLVPLSIEIDPKGEPHIRAADPRYASPGPEEGQLVDSEN